MTAESSTARIAARVDPETVFCGWADRHPHAFWLDAGPDASAGRSWIGIGEPVPVEEVLAVRTGPDPERVEQSATSSGRGPVPGSWVGWFGYEPGAGIAGAPRSASEDGDDRWMRVVTAVEFDHAGGGAVVHAAGSDAAAVAATLSRLSAPTPVRPAPMTSATPRHTADQYSGLIERCREQIRLGNAYQLCLTTRFEVQGVIDAVGVYRRLRRTVSAHHGGILRIGGRSLVSASPEQFLETRGGRVRTHPIKGTRPRGDDAETDDALARELSSDVKERAENVMIVDLMRNDLSRVCLTGTVTVERLFAVESYPAVHQLVSTVAGDLAANLSVGELLSATFPAGSMTGAPKLSAMTLLYRFEGGPRGIFAGCFGWVSPDGDLDLAMVIRSIVVDPDRAYVGAGGGITWLSQPDFEVAEVALKARGPLAALGSAIPAGWPGSDAVG